MNFLSGIGRKAEILEKQFLVHVRFLLAHITNHI